MRANPRWPTRHCFGEIFTWVLIVGPTLWLVSAHSGAWPTGAPAVERVGWALAVGLIYLACCGYWTRRSSAQSQPIPDAALLVVYASQTGFAHRVAELTANSLFASGLRYQLLPISRLDRELLVRSKRILFIVSTTGEGDPPDTASSFVEDLMDSATTPPLRLEHLDFAVLALGDRNYSHYCSFGRALDVWLLTMGAQSLFDRVEVDNAEPSALRHWQHCLAQIGASPESPDWDPPEYQDWRLDQRRLLNPQSAGGAVFDLTLTPCAIPLPDWQAGDIAEVGPRHDPAEVAEWLRAQGLDGQLEVNSADSRGLPLTLEALLAQSHWPDPNQIAGVTLDDIPALLTPLPHREYSIATTPAEGCLRLLVRRMQRRDGSLGIGSGWLCQHARPGETVQLRIRNNPGFHPPPPERPLILIGNGTGIAGMRAHLSARAAQHSRQNWLMFGERLRLHDFHYQEEIEQWQREGWLQHIDCAYSRDQPERIYVQDVLALRGDRLRTWVDVGAVILVCGSQAGMAPGVDATLREILGSDQLAAMRRQGRYRRDIY